MPRISGVRRLRPLRWALAHRQSPTRAPLAAARAISTTGAARDDSSQQPGKKQEWLRGKLWKGEAPGPEDPYTQRPEPDTTSTLPEEALEPRPHRTGASGRGPSRLALPPKRTQGMVEAEVKAVDPTYEPATNIEDLDEVAPLKSWWDQPGHWGPESEFKGFGSADKVVERDVVEIYLRQAVVEVLALRQSGAFDEWATRRWADGGRPALEAALALQVEVRDGTASLTGDVSTVAEGLTAVAQAAEATEETKGAEKVSLEEAQQMIRAWDASWKSIPLDDQLKFALRKRLYQLTGTLVPDARLGAARTVKHVLTLATKPPRTPKLAETLERRGDLPRLANVAVHGRKIGPVERETALGRWKVIEAELRRRGLPVLGTGGVGRFRERDWLRGKV